MYDLTRHVATNKSFLSFIHGKSGYRAVTLAVVNGDVKFVNCLSTIMLMQQQLLFLRIFMLSVLSFNFDLGHAT
jgi:hypothetical protein